MERLVARGNRVRDPMSGRNDGSLLAMVERGLLLFLIEVLASRVLLPLRAFLFPRGARLLELPSDDTGTYMSTKRHAA